MLVHTSKTNKSANKLNTINDMPLVFKAGTMIKTFNYFSISRLSGVLLNLISRPTHPSHSNLIVSPAHLKNNSCRRVSRI